MRRVCVFWLAVLCLPVLASRSLVAQPVQQDRVSNLVNALGFLHGQQLGLERIRSEFPELALQAREAHFSFRRTFGTAEERMWQELRSLAGDRYEDYVGPALDQIESKLNAQALTKQQARRFLARVESRAEGDLPPSILNTLLGYEYRDRPAAELQDGFFSTFRTEGHPKAKGLNVQFEYPESWQAQEGKRPNVVQLVKSHSNQVPASALIMVRDLQEELAETQLSAEERDQIDELIRTREGAQMLADWVFSDSILTETALHMGVDSVRNVRTQRMVLDRWPGAMLEFVGRQQRLDTTLTMYWRQYSVVYKQYLIMLQCSVARLPEESDSTFRERVDRFAPLFEQMANSLVILDQY